MSIYSIKRRLKLLLSPFCVDGFLYQLSDVKKIMDVGCGNDSVLIVKNYKPSSYYVGVDVADYNLSEISKRLIDEYVVADPERFHEVIRELPSDFDAIICSHNLEHCYRPYQVIDSMISRLRVGGELYLSFPSEKTVGFPNRGGCLNFYDDPTHRNVMKWEEVLGHLERSMEISFASRNYSPYGLVKVGEFNEKKSVRKNKTMPGTWAYYGFESVIWACKERE